MRDKVPKKSAPKIRIQKNVNKGCSQIISKMFGEKAFELVKELQRSPDNLPPYNVSIKYKQ